MLQTEAAEARAHVQPSPFATQRAQDRRYAERKLSGKDPNAPSTVQGGLPFPQMRRALFEQHYDQPNRLPILEGGDGRRERTVGERGPLPDTPGAWGGEGDDWQAMGDGSEWLEESSLEGSIVSGETESVGTEEKLRAYKKVSWVQPLSSEDCPKLMSRQTCAADESVRAARVPGAQQPEADQVD